MDSKTPSSRHNQQQLQQQQQQQQQQSSSVHPLSLPYSSSYEYQLWEHFSNLQSTFTSRNNSNTAVPTNITTGTTDIMNSLAKYSQQSYREYNQHSLLGKYVFLFYS